MYIFIHIHIHIQVEFVKSLQFMRSCGSCRWRGSPGLQLLGHLHEVREGTGAAQADPVPNEPLVKASSLEFGPCLGMESNYLCMHIDVYVHTYTCLLHTYVYLCICTSVFVGNAAAKMAP